MTTSSTLALCINWGIGAVAAAVLLPVLDRLREMNWRSHPPQVVAMNVLLAVMLGGIAFSGLIDESIITDIGFADDVAALHHLAGVLVSALWVWASRRAWRSGQSAGHPARRASDYMPGAGAPYKVEPPPPSAAAGEAGP